MKTFKVSDRIQTSVPKQTGTRNFNQNAHHHAQPSPPRTLAGKGKKVLRQYDSAIVARDIPGTPLKKGAEVGIVEVLKRPSSATYIVELANDWWGDLDAKDLKPAAYDETKE